MHQKSCFAIAVSLSVLAACGEPSAQTEVTPGELAVSSPMTCGAGKPIDSSLALLQNGGGCMPVGLNDPVTAQLFLVNPEWAPVVNGISPLSTPVLIHGTVADSHISTSDFPSTHISIDQNTDILLDPEDAGCLATGNVLSQETNAGATLGLEWEVASYPPWAWAGPGDRIVALGRWIFDCGHEDPVPGKCGGTGPACVLDRDCTGGATCDGVQWGYRAELHPPQAVAVIREGRGAPMPQPGNGGAVKPIPVTRADVLVSGDGGGSGDLCVVSRVLGSTPDELIANLLAHNCFPLSEPLSLLPPAPILNAFDFEFDVPLPPVPHDGVPFWRVESRDTPSISGPAVPADLDVKPVLQPVPHLHVKVLMTKAVGGKAPTGFAGTLFAGWRKASAPDMKHLRVTVEAVVVRSPLKPGVDLPALPLPVPTPPGWDVNASVNGEWQPVPGMAGIDAAGSFPVTSPLVFDQWLPTQGTLHVHAQGLSLGCQDTIRGQSLGAVIAHFFTGDTAQAQAQAQVCLLANRVDGGEVDIDFHGPQFGAGGSPYEVASKGGLMEGAYALRFKIERLSDDTVAQR